MQNPPRACILDLDGTLIDSLADLADAANASLAAAGYPEHPCDAYRTFVGNGITVLIQRALPPDVARGMSPQALQHIVDHMNRLYADNWHAKTLCYAGIPELVARLHRQSIPLAVLSNKPHVFTCKIIDYFFPSKPFRLVYGARPDYPHKPDPAMALHIAQELNLPPADIAFVGDSNVDISTGLRAGMSTIGVCWGFRTREELISAGATVLVEQPEDIALLLAP